MVAGLAYFNDHFVGLQDGVLPLEERGLQFGDSIYEVVRVYNGIPFTLREHLERLEKSATSILLNLPKTRQEIETIVKEGIKRLDLTDGTIYFQVTRGNAPRNHPFPKETKENLIMIWKRQANLRSSDLDQGVQLITCPDERWKNCFIKTTCLLPNVLAKEKALRQGAFEALFIRDGLIKECTSMNIFLVKDGVIKTPVADHSILNGITRQVVIKLAQANSFDLIEAELIEDDLAGADEVFVTSTTKEVVPVVKIDDFVVGFGKQGDICKKIQVLFSNYVKEQCQGHL